jgi:transcriptional antiterminator/mannitol/fructose-specific phosphotransferase system IIA component (Ntr-type)
VLINQRCIKILNRLQSADTPILLGNLSESFGISVRTIQTDLDEIDYFLLSNGLPCLTRIRKHGVSIDYSADDRLRLRNIIDNRGIGSIIINNNERIELLLKILISQPGFIKVYDLAERLQVSKGTTINDLNTLRNEIEKAGLQIISNSRYGVKMQGDEGSLRNYMLSRHINNSDINIIYDIEKYYRGSISNKYYKLRSYEEIQYILELVYTLEIQLEKKLSDISFFGFTSSIELCLLRVQQKRTIVLDSLKLESLYVLREFAEVFKLTKELETHFNLVLTKDEIGYLTIQLLGSTNVNSDSSNDLKNYAEIQMIVCNLINKVGFDLGRDFSKNIKLYNDLIYHVRPAIYRMRNSLKQVNPLLDDIKKNYREIFDSVRQNFQLIDSMSELEMSEDEIGYITIHFASACMKETLGRFRRPQVLIVCNSGIGTSNILSSKLANIYEMKIVGTVALHEMNVALSKSSVDYIVTTIDLPIRNIEVIKVTPLITTKDIRILDKFFDHKYDDLIDLKKLMDIIEKNCEVKNREMLISDMNSEFTLIRNVNLERKSLPMLRDVMNEGLIELDFHAKNWEDAVRRAGNLLLINDCIEERYIDSMVGAVKSIGAYIVIGKGIALPHSRSSDGVKCIGISLLRLSEPVVFGHPENDPVDLVFALSAIDNSSHMVALSDLAKLLNEPENIQLIRNAGCTSEIMNLISTKGN